MRSYKQSNWNPFYNISLKQESASLPTTFTCKLPFLRFHIPTFTCNVCLYLPFCLGIWEPNILTVSKSSQNFPHKNPHQVKAALKGQNSRSLQRIRHAKRCLGSCHCGVVFFVLPVGEDIYICPKYGVENRCMIIKDNVIAYQNASCHIHNQQNISISYCHHFKYIQTSKSLFGLQTLTTFFPKISSSVTWPHAPRFHATRWIQKSWRQWRDVRPLFEARSWHVGTWNSFGRMMKNDGPLSI